VDLIKEIGDLVSQVEAHNWHGIGTDLGTIVRKLLLGNSGPHDALFAVPATAIDWNLVGADVLQFVEGLADGLVNGDIEDPLKQCWKDATLSVTDLKIAVEDFEKKDKADIEAGLRQLGSV